MKNKDKDIMIGASNQPMRSLSATMSYNIKDPSQAEAALKMISSKINNYSHNREILGSLSEILLQLSKEFFSNGKKLEAMQSLVKYAEFDKYNTEINYKIGLLGLMLDKPDEAQNAFRNAAKMVQSPKLLSELYNNIGISYFKMNLNSEAKISFYQAILNNPNNYLIIHNLAKCFYQSGQYREAAYYCNEALKIEPFSVHTRHLNALSYLGMKDLYKFSKQILIISDLKNVPENINNEVNKIALCLVKSRKVNNKIKKKLKDYLVRA